MSVLDRANSRTGESEFRALRRVIARAQHAERLGFHRFWVAEHHGVPGIVGSAPTVLMASVAARTTSIRVGSGGVMLPAHQPIVVAEQAATLEALHPGRIDLGLGRSLGFTAAVRAALRQDADAAERFPDDLSELLGYLRGEAAVSARPQNRAATPVYLLATGRGLDRAAQAGLGVVLGGPSLFSRADRDEHPGIARYRREFRPSPFAERPFVMVAANIAVADSRQEARELLLPEAWALVASRSTGEFPPLQSAQQVRELKRTDRQDRRLGDHLETGIAGSPAEVRAELEALIEFTGADELLATGGMFDVEAQARSDELLIAALSD
ncbi:MsnO8 family LLM class oxidoreductase [Brevibacterium daeguense]|uniref:MsnO8 family LLM class oxidoreductase n=1 Tax=Brevibacterium daeguense TaxID=909936 RepID=A0ABP8EIQ6_9MICO